MNNIETHNRIDSLIKAGSVTVVVADVKTLIAIDFDARKYFFTQANENWLEWLLGNGFLEVIKEKAKDPTTFSYQTPELDYLVRVAEKLPAEVTDIMLSVNILDNFNPEVVDRFVWICSKLPAEQLMRMAPKIRDEKWIPLMKGFNRWGFEYKNMLEKLSPEKDAETIVPLAEAILSVKPQEKSGESKIAWRTDSPFYFNQVDDTGVFEHLAAITGAGAERAFNLVSKTLGEIATQGDPGEDEIFKIGDTFHLFDVDFFELSVDHGRHISSRDDVRSLAAVVKVLAQRLIGGTCDDAKEAHRLFSENLGMLPDSRSMWRLKLFVWSLCPHVFQSELIEAFDRAFAYENNWSIVSGAEYEWAIKKCFGELPDVYHFSYIQRTLDYYEDREMDLRSSGYDILSCIPEHLLTQEDKERAEEIFGKPLNPDHKPEPTISRSYAGVVVPQAVVPEDEFSKLPIAEIVANLKGKWSPTALREADTERDFLRPRNAEGMADRLQGDIKKRLGEYVENAQLFFDLVALDPHYTYAFMRGLCDAYKITKLPPETNWNYLIALFSDIKLAAVREPFDHGPRDRRGVDGWLAGWDGVHSAMADLIKVLLGEDGEDKAIPFETYQEQILDTIKYLLQYQDPEPERHDEKATKHPSTGKEQYTASDPFTTAINSVRGRAFQAFVLFVYRNAERMKRIVGADVLPHEVKEIYERMLDRENTEAMMFMFGHYLASFYYRDQSWSESLLPLIFPKDKPDLFLASWEGYLASSLYEELFEKLAPLYEYAIELDPSTYTLRRYFAEIDDSLAGHIALAYMHFSSFNTESQLFKKFWNTNSGKRHEAFVSFIGRHAISRENAIAWDIEHKIEIPKLAALWDWILENSKEPSVFTEFGFWVNAKEGAGIFNEKWLADHLRRTLEKSGGKLGWDYGMMESLPILAKVAPEDAIAILRSYLTVTEIGTQYRAWVHIDGIMVDIFRTLFQNPITKDATYALVNDLLPHGSGQFWKLKEALE